MRIEPSDPNLGNDRRYPPELRSLEAQLIASRREKAGYPSAQKSESLPKDCLGLALSGGGIRSATFCLGFLQVLAGHRLLRRVDFLSTVSGGGYCGGFLGRWFSRLVRLGIEAPAKAEAGGPAAEPHIRQLEDELNSHDSEPLRWLRESGRYMSPTGPGDVGLTVAIYLRNIVAVHLVIAIALLVVLLVGVVLRGVLGRLIGALSLQSSIPTFLPSADSLVWWSPWILLPVILLAVVAIPLGWAYWLIPQSEKERGWKNTAVRSMLIVLVSAATGAWIVANWRYAGSLHVVSATFTALAAITMIVWLCAWGWREMRGRKPDIAMARNRLSTALTSALGITGVTLVFALVDSFGQTFYAVGACQGWATTTRDPRTLPPVAAAIAIIAVVQKLSPILGRSPSAGRWKIPLNLALSVASAFVAAVLAIALATAAYALSWSGKAPLGDPGRILIRYEDIPSVALSQERLVSVGLGKAHPDHVVSGEQPLLVPAVAMLAALFLSFWLGRTFQFLNLSSHHALYSARLTRAYLGATNPHRSGRARSVREVYPGDDVPFERYRPHAAGGPLHLINVTINETVAGESQVEYRDRKGVPMAIGPVGVSVGARHHALWVDRDTEATAEMCDEEPGGPFRHKPPLLRPVEPPGSNPSLPAFHPLRSDKHPLVDVEPRTLGQWIAISGAAFTTGLGYRTSLGSSLLLGISNIRLGYWWNSSIGALDRSTPQARRMARTEGYRLGRVFPVQSYLFNEFLGRFYGTLRKHWYLSDGGHFENTACYELIRRRVSRIICCDCGADPEYRWEDLANLARKVRIDLNAEMTFLRPDEMSASWVPFGLRGRVGPLSRICKAPEAPGEGGSERFHGTIARVYYKDDPKQRDAYYCRGAPWGTMILFVKPSMTGEERLDVREYSRVHPDFPQESTLDQNFDESQWESYRKLGEHVGGALLDGFEDDAWWQGDQS